MTFSLFSPFLVNYVNPFKDFSRFQNELDPCWCIYFSGSFNELQIDEDDSLIDISINTEFEQNDILNDLKAKINANLSENQKRNIKQTNEQRMNDIISEKLKKLR